MRSARSTAWPPSPRSFLDTSVPAVFCACARNPLDGRPLVSLVLPLVPTYADTLTALADPMRRSIFERVASAPCAVGEIARELPISRPAVSQHLRVLREAGLVTDRAAGTRRIYRVDLGGMAALRAYLDHFWDEALASFKQAVEAPRKDTP